MLLEDENKVFLIVGLGNPGREYRNTRHNAGFWVLDSLANRLGESFTRVQSRALVTKSVYEQNRLILAKPQTYMNESGQAVGSLIRFYKVPVQNIMIVYDDVDLPFGTIRIRPGGGSAGQKGMSSIIEKLGINGFPRLRIGIGRPPGKLNAAAYVLQEFSKQEEKQITETVDKAVEAILSFVTVGIEKTMTQYNSQDPD